MGRTCDIYERNEHLKESLLHLAQKRKEKGTERKMLLKLHEDMSKAGHAKGTIK